MNFHSGQCEGNVNKISPDTIFNASTETPLTELGRQQAILVGQRLKDTNFDMAFSSDLSRAYDTASAIIGNSVAITKDPLLRERDYGVFENKPWKLFLEAKELQFKDGETDKKSLSVRRKNQICRH